MHIRTAVIPVAGAGSRVFPVTTAIEKCLMPVYAGSASRPLIDFMVQDCAAAGIERIIFVTSERGRRQLQDYFGPDLTDTLRRQLRRIGKDDFIERETQRRRSYGVSFEYVIQSPDEYGTTVPPYICRDRLAGEPAFALMGGDDFIYHPDGTSELRLAIDAWSHSGADHAIMGAPLAREAATRYGNLDVSDGSRLRRFDEKPPLERVAANPVINISRYILSDKIWKHLEYEMSLDRGTEEHLITHAITAALEDGQSFYVHRIQGEYLDGGSFDGLLQASQYITAHPPTGR
ncbi:MAG TPA: sugar phosphate nucleotidyltransferase [Candidatus Saccharimonadales bacterium]|jgi:UTP--glucose-1-phosphate uridylyltransferase